LGEKGGNWERRRWELNWEKRGGNWKKRVGTRRNGGENLTGRKGWELGEKGV